MFPIEQVPTDNSRGGDKVTSDLGEKIRDWGGTLESLLSLEQSPHVAGPGVREGGHQGWNRQPQIALPESLRLTSTKHGKPPAFSWRLLSWPSHSILFVTKLSLTSPEQN